MKEATRTISGLIAIALIAFFTSCEGPAGKDGDETCMVCHGADQIAAIDAQFASSVHAGGLVAVDYAGGQERCAPCHSSEQFIEYAITGDVVGDISDPSAWTCNTCHGLHSNFDESDWEVRLSDPVTAVFDETVSLDFGNNSNLCANCHQSRRAEPNISNPGSEFEITNTHYGPHHGPQANLLAGVGFAEIAGSTPYPTAGSDPHMGVGCTGCHMGDYDAENNAGGHSWVPSLTTCNECHTTEGFDYGGVQTDIEEKLRDLKVLLLAQGVIEEGLEIFYELNEETGAIELDTVSEGLHPVVGEHTMVRAQAFFNWIGIEEDRSLGVHNPKYIEALLDNSIEALEAN